MRAQQPAERHRERRRDRGHPRHVRQCVSARHTRLIRDGIAERACRRRSGRVKLGCWVVHADFTGLMVRHGALCLHPTGSSRDVLGTAGRYVSAIGRRSDVGCSRSSRRCRNGTSNRRRARLPVSKSLLETLLPLLALLHTDPQPRWMNGFRDAIPPQATYGRKWHPEPSTPGECRRVAEMQAKSRRLGALPLYSYKSTSNPLLSIGCLVSSNC